MTIYKGEVRSALRRCRKVLRSAGIALSKTSGRYEPFCNKQIITRGIVITRIGVSATIAVSARLGRPRFGGNAELRETRQMESEALTALRAAGLPFDERGWMECEHA